MNSFAQNLVVETITLVNASTHRLDFTLGSPMGRHRFVVEPLKAVDVLKAWTTPNPDSNGNLKLPSTLAQYAPHLKSADHPDLASARQALTNAKLRAEGKPPAKDAAHPYLSWPPTADDLDAEKRARELALAAAAVR